MRTISMDTWRLIGIRQTSVVIEGEQAEGMGEMSVRAYHRGYPNLDEMGTFIRTGFKYRWSRRSGRRARLVDAFI